MQSASDLWCAYVEDRSGMEFAGARARVLTEAVAARVAAGGHPTADAYFRHLSGPAGGAEWNRLLDRLLNSDTRFFRDPPALSALSAVALPGLRERRQGADRLALWSAGCSTGQEAYSLAITCLADPALAGWRIEVLGTDVSRTALARAAAGVYKPHALTDVPEVVRRRFFEPAGTTEFRLAPNVRAAVRFEEHDLLTGPPVPAQDVIFCQNVLIYYRADCRAEIVRRLAGALTAGGYLFLGAAEAVGIPTPGLELIRLEDTWVYRRTG